MRAAATPAARAAWLGRALAAALLIAWANEVPTARPIVDGPSSVLGEKVARCAGDAVPIDPIATTVAAENAPLTVTIADGKVTSVLAPPVKITPGQGLAQPFVSISLGAPRTADGAIAVTVAVRNDSSCPASLSVARTVAHSPGRLQDVSQVRFDGRDAIVVPAGQRVTGLASIPLRGDGTYEITASTLAELR